MEEAFGGLNLASLKCAFLPQVWDIRQSKLKVVFQATLLHYISRFFGENI